jgi:hypothetical protein
MIVTTVTSSPGIDANTIVESTTDSGVEIKRVTTQWAKVVAPGAVLAPAMYQIVQRVTIVTYWAPFYGIDANGAPITLPSTALLSRTTTTELLTGTPARTGTGVVWVQGGSWKESAAQLMVAEILYEVFTWKTTDCTIASSTVYRWQLYSPLGGTGIPYSDGSVRVNTWYQFQEVWRDYTLWGGSFGQMTSTRWYLSSPGVETYGQVGPSSTLSSIAPITAITTPPATGSPLIPQISQQPIVAEYDATDASGYAKLTSSPGALPYPETIAELNSIAKRRIRRALSDQIDIPHRCIPFLRPGDHVTVTNHVRGLVNVDGYVSAIKRTAAVTNAAFRQVTTVMIPPRWI